MRALLVVLLVAVASVVAAPAHADTGADLVTWYGKRAHWKQVRREVLDWHGTTRNACVAFLSTALRDIGVDVPRDAEMEGERVSRLTRPMSLWLEDHLGWTRVDDLAALRPGDVVFTEHAAYPWHVFVFVAWIDRDARVARVLDNHGWNQSRPLLGDVSGDDLDAGRGITPFAYALRAPADGSAMVPHHDPSR
jgi:hypothetical protein